MNAPPRRGDQRVGFAGHHLVRREQAWHCRCGVALGASRAAARDTMRYHRLDLWVRTTMDDTRMNALEPEVRAAVAGLALYSRSSSSDGNIAVMHLRSDIGVVCEALIGVEEWQAWANWTAPGRTVVQRAWDGGRPGR